MRHSVLRFALACDDALGKHVAKGHWRQRDPKKILDSLRRAQVHLSTAITACADEGEILEHATSVANYAMMIADLCGDLKKPWQP